MSEDRPNAWILIAEAQRTLREELVPNCAGSDRYKALMIVNALGIALRELETATSNRKQSDLALKSLGYESDSEVVAALRRGNSALTPDLHTALMEDATARVKISNPKAL